MLSYSANSSLHNTPTLTAASSLRRGSEQSLQSTDTFDHQPNAIAQQRTFPSAMDAHGMYYPGDMSAYSSPFTIPQEVFYAAPGCATTSFVGQPDYTVADDFHSLRTDSSMEFSQPMVASGPFMSPSGSFDGNISQSSSSTSLIAMSNAGGPVRGHPSSPSGSGYRGVQRYTPYSISRPTKKRTGVACDPCRAKKQKCDGAKRCHQCVTNNLECKYREIEPKTSGNVLDQIAKLAASSNDLIHNLNEKLDNISARVRTLEAQVERMQFRCQRCNHLHAEPDGKISVSPRL